MKKAYLVVLDSTAQPGVVDYNLHQAITENFVNSEIWAFADGDNAQASVYVDGSDPYKNSLSLPTAEEIRNLPE